MYSRQNDDCDVTTEQELNRRATRVETFEVCVPTHAALRMFIIQLLVSELHFVTNRNAEVAYPLLFSPGNCMKIGGLYC